jgi:hypothetical protein
MSINFKTYKEKNTFKHISLLFSHSNERVKNTFKGLWKKPIWETQGSLVWFEHMTKGTLLK